MSAASLRKGSPPFGLVGDIGGTNARFALVVGDRRRWSLTEAVSVRCADFPSLEAAVDGYLAARPSPRPALAALAVAGPVKKGSVAMTNTPWRITEAALADTGLSSVRLLNDYEALALAFAEKDREPRTAPIGPDLPRSQAAPLLVMGAGTGFGMAALIPGGSASPRAIPTEAGHVGFAPGDELEVKIWGRLAARFGRVSIERLLSGPGLANLHEALTDIGGRPERIAPEIVSDRAEAGEPKAVRTVEMFFTLLARAAGDFVLSYGAFGGVHLTGGVVHRLASRLEPAAFRRAFEDKGRFRDYVRKAPSRLIVDPLASLIGAAAALPSQDDLETSE